MPPPALLLHGFLGRGADWQPVAARLAATRTVLAPDWLDDALSGLSDSPDDASDWPFEASDRLSGPSDRGFGASDPGFGASDRPPDLSDRGGRLNDRASGASDRPSEDLSGGPNLPPRGGPPGGRGGGFWHGRETAPPAADTAGPPRGGRAESVGHRQPASQEDAEAFDTSTPRPGGLAHAADRLAARLDAAGIDRADVAGYSMGGRLALLFALRHPARVARLALVSASPGLLTPEERSARRAHDAALARALVADFPAFLHRWTRQPVFAALSDAQRERIERDRLAHVDPARAARALVLMGTGAMPSLWEPLRRLRVETVAIAGALDPAYVALATSSDLVAAGVRGLVIPDAGHALPTEAPDALADLLDYLFA